MRIKNFLKLFLLIIFLMFVSGCILRSPTPPPQDTEKPVVNILFPQDGAELSGVVEIKIEATDNVGVKKVTLYINGEEKGSVNASTYTYNWDTTTVPNGGYIITAKAEDTSGNIGEKSINVTVDNPVVPGLVFKDSFEGKTNNASQYTSPSYGGPIPSTNKIQFISGKKGQGVYLYELDSYVAYTTGYINPSEGTIKFYFKPEPDVYEDYKDLYANWGIYLLDVSGFGWAVPGAFWVGIAFGTENNIFISKIWGGVYDYTWSYISPYLINLSSDKFYEIAFVWNMSEGKIKLYIDGEKVGDANYKAPDSTGQIFFIGHSVFDHGTYGPRSMKGVYDELEIYNIDIYDID